MYSLREIGVILHYFSNNSKILADLLGFPHLHPVQGFSKAGFGFLTGLGGAFEQLTVQMNPLPSNLQSDVKVISM